MYKQFIIICVHLCHFQQKAAMTTFPKTLKDPRTCRVFVSSPFGGCELEREELVRKYFPQLSHICQSKGVQFVAVDMRWGITEEAATDAQVRWLYVKFIYCHLKINKPIKSTNFHCGYIDKCKYWHIFQHNIGCLGNTLYLRTYIVVCRLENWTQILRIIFISINL